VKTFAEQTTTKKRPYDWLAKIARIPAVRPILVALGFVACALFMLWPLPLHATTAVQDLGDPLYEIWTMRWAQHQLVNDPLRIWDGNTGYPFADSLLFSEPRLSTSIIAWPIQLISGNDVLAYNVMLIGSYALVGIGMAFLIWEITGVAGAGFVAGFAAAFVPYRFGHLSHLNLLSYGWTPLALWAIVRYFRRRSPIDALLAAIFLTIQVLASDTIALMTGFLAGTMILMLLWPERRRLSPKLLAGVALILGLPLLAEIPIALARVRVDRIYDFHRDLATVQQMSATLQTYISVNPGNHFWWSTLPHAYPNPLFPGLIATVGAIAALLLVRRCWSRWVVYFAAVAVVGFTLSLGPLTSIGGNSFHLPYYYFYQYVPGFNAMRDAARFGMLALLGIEMLAGLGFAAAWKTLKPRLPTNWTPIAAPLLVVLLLIGAAAELRNTTGVATVPRDEQTLAAYNWLASQPTGPVFELPANGLFTDVLWTTQQIYYSTRYWDPIIAAYTSFIPQRDAQMLAAINGGTKNTSLVTPANIGYLQDLGVRYIIVHHWPDYDWQLALTEAAKLPELTRVGDLGNTTVYTVAPSTRAPIVYQLHAPSVANAGQAVVADFVTRNDNPTAAINWLKSDPTLAVTWRTMNGQLVEKVNPPFHLDVTTSPGLAIHPFTLTAPTAPGTYQLTINCPGVVDPLVQTVEVNATSVASPDAAPLVLRSLGWDKKSYRPGDWVAISAEWEVRNQPAKPLTATLQLLNADDQNVAQWDGQPFGDALPTTDWTPGSTLLEPLLVQIPADAGPGPFRLMIALYDHSTPDLARETIELPNGQTAPQFVSEPLPFASGGP
jgi:hypothetical protein